MVRVLLVEDHALVRSGLRVLLERASDIHVLGEASNGQQAVEMTKALKPDLVIMDIMMPRLNGIQAAEHLRELKLPVKVLLLSMYADEALIHQALQSGVKGYVLKTAASEELIRAIRAVARGETYLSSEISTVVFENTVHPRRIATDDPLGHLSPREKEILQLIAEGHTSMEIAATLSISEKTVEKHRANLMDKLKVRNLAGLVRLAVKYRLVDKN